MGPVGVQRMDVAMLWALRRTSSWFLSGTGPHFGGLLGAPLRIEPTGMRLCSICATWAIRNPSR